MQNKKVNSINGVKIITRYSPATIVTIFFTFVLIFIPLSQLLFMIFALEVDNLIIPSLASNETNISFTGLKVIFGLIDLIRIYFLKETGVELNEFSTYFSKIIDATNSQIGQYGITILIGVFMLILVAELIVAVIDAVLFIEMLLRGRLNNYKIPKNTATAMFIFQFILSFFGPVSQILSNKYLGFEYNIQNMILPFVFFGVSFIVFFVLTVIYVVSFKDAVFVRYVNQYIEEQERAKKETQAPTYNPYPSYTPPIHNPYPQFSNTPYQQPITSEFPNTANKSPNPNRERKGLPADIKSIGDQAFNADLDLQVAIIPNNIKSIGSSAFANCINLQVVSIPVSVQFIGYNAFFNCYSLKRINFNGTKEEWKRIQRGSNWLTKAGTTSVVCLDGVVIVNPHH